MNHTTNRLLSGSEFASEYEQQRLNSSTVTQSNFVSTPWHYTINSNTITGMQKVKAECEIPKLKIADFKQLDWN
jgi:hypothetical protein